MNTLVEFSELQGKTFTQIKKGYDFIKFYCTDGSVYEQYHQQDCCESVSLEDVCGDLDDLLNSEILQADEEMSDDLPSNRYHDDCYDWTFYKLGTIKGRVTLKWFGSSNSYYSTDAHLYRVQ